MNRSGRVLCSAVVLGVSVMFAVPAASLAQDAATSATAQGGGRGDRPRGGGMIFGAALQVSGLTPEQKTKIEKLQADFREKMKAARSAAGTGEGQSRGGWNNPEMQKMMAESRTQVEAILTDEQKKELEEKLKAGGGRGRGGQNKETSSTEKK